MPINTNRAGADAASDQQVAEAFRQLIDNDPEIQAVIRRVWGDTTRDQRPSNTPKHLEKANAQASKEIAAILKRKGVNLPSRTFINPRSGQLEGHRGWSGLSGLQKAAIIGAAAATGVGAGMALAGGGAAAAGAGGAGSAAAGGGAGAAGAGLAATPGITAGLSALPGVAVPSMAGTLGGTAAAGGAISAMPLAMQSRNIAGPLATTTSLPASTTLGTRAAGGSLLSRLLNPETLRAGARGLGAIGQAAASNRGTALDAMMAGDEMRILLDRERRDAETDIWNKMRAVNYTKSGGAGVQKPSMSASGKPFTQFNFGPAPISEADKALASELEVQLMNRLRNPMQLSDYASKMEPGKTEKLTNWLGPGLDIVSSLYGKK